VTATFLPGTTIAECAAAYTKMGWSVVEIPRGSKAPRHGGWNTPGGYVTSPDAARKTWGRGQNMGVVLGPSRVCTLDLDDLENSRGALKAVGIDLDLLLDDETAVRLIGNPAHAKLVFGVPEGVELSTKKLNWPSSVKAGEMTGIFELRAGPVQDILPPSIHPDTQQPYRWGRPFWDNGGVPPLAQVLEYLWTDWDKYLPRMEAACPWAPPGSSTPLKDPTTQTVWSASFDDFALEHGLVPPPGGWIGDGSLHRCDAAGPDGVVGRNDGAYFLHTDEPENGGIQNWHRHTGMQPWKPARGNQVAQTEMGTNGSQPGTAPVKTPDIMVLETMQTESAWDLLQRDIPPPDYMIEGITAREEVTGTMGGPKEGKSGLSVQAMLSAAAGRSFLCFPVPKPRRVLFVTAEGSERRFKERIIMFRDEMGLEERDLRDFHHVHTKGQIRIDNPAGAATILRLAQGFDIVGLDTMYALLTTVDENSHKDFRIISSFLDELKYSEEGKAVWLLHHFTKNAGGEGGVNEVRGAGLAGYIDSVLRFYKRRKPAGTHYEIRFDLRNEPERDSLLLVRNGSLFALAPPKTRVGTVHVVQVIEDAGGQIQTRAKVIAPLMEFTNMGERSCLDALARAIRDGKVRAVTRKGIAGKSYYVPSSSND